MERREQISFDAGGEIGKFLLFIQIESAAICFLKMGRLLTTAVEMGLLDNLFSISQRAIGDMVSPYRCCQHSRFFLACRGVTNHFDFPEM